MKEQSINLLILSYHYLPLNVIATYRPKGFVDHLHKYGIYPTILTHRWEHDGNSRWKWHDKGEDVIEEAQHNYRVFRIPRTKTKTGNLLRLLEKLWILNKLRILFSWLFGHLDTAIDDLDSYLNYRKFVFKHLKQYRYDMIMGIFSPHHHLKLCYELNKEFNVPYILDFRDLWINEATDPNYNPDWKIKLKERLIVRSWAKWLSKACFYTTISKPWVDKIGKLTGVPGHLVMHGYDGDIEEISTSQPSKKEFIILFLGSLYDNQDLEGFVKGFSDFRKSLQKDSSKIILLGVKRTSSSNARIQNNVEEILDKYLEPGCYKITERRPRDQVLVYIQKSSILLLLTYKNEIGRHGGKFFEYMGSRRLILAYPDNKSVICEDLQSTSAGLVVNTPEEVSHTLKKLYNEWEKNGIVKYLGIKSEIAKYSREYQTMILSKKIKDHLKSQDSQK